VNSNGYNVGWIETGEWMQYDVNISEDAIYDIKVRLASAEANGRFHFEAGDASVTSINSVQNTGGWKNWMTLLIQNVILSTKDDKLKFSVDAGVFNLSSFEFVKKGATTTTPASLISALTLDEHTVQLSINKYIPGPLPASPTGFELHVNGTPVPISNVETGSSNSRIIKITTGYTFQAKEDIEVSYSGTQVFAVDGTPLSQFTRRDVRNMIIYYHPVPGRIQAEDYSLQVGVQLENTSDVGGGQNIGYLDVGDYCDYYINVQQSGTYNVSYRTASESAGGGVQLELINPDGNPTVIQTVNFPATGGWQTWTSTTKSVYLQAGQHHMRLRITNSQFNINWFEFSIETYVNDTRVPDNLKLFPNPGKDIVYLQGNTGGLIPAQFEIYDFMGHEVLVRVIETGAQINEAVNMATMPDGAYFIVIRFTDGSFGVKKIMKTSN